MPQRPARSVGLDLGCQGLLHAERCAAGRQPCMPKCSRQECIAAAWQRRYGLGLGLRLGVGPVANGLESAGIPPIRGDPRKLDRCRSPTDWHASMHHPMVRSMHSSECPRCDQALRCTSD